MNAPLLLEQFVGTFHRFFELVVTRDLSPVPASLEQEITADPVLFRMLSAGGFAQFGRGPDVDYDPVCFDLRSRDADGDCRIVKIDHEGILIHEKLTIVDELAPSFQHLVADVIQRASRLSRQDAD